MSNHPIFFIYFLFSTTINFCFLQAHFSGDLKLHAQLKNLENLHGIEGYVVVVYPHLKGRAVISGGSSMGEAFLDMFEINPNPTGTFLDFVKGQLALGKVMGGEVSLPRQKRKQLGATAHLTLENCANDLGM